MPLFLRPFLYFFIRFILKLGFMDGKQGFIWYVLQGFCCQFLVDAKVYEIKKKFGFDEGKIKKYLIDAGGGAKWSEIIRRSDDDALLILPLRISLNEERRAYAA